MRAFPLILVLSLAAPAFAQSMPGMRGMDHGAVKTGKGVGVVTALDVKAARVTIKHGPIPAVGWPAMTMTFRASPPALLKGIRVGQTVAFDVRTKGMDAEVRSIRPH